MRKQYKAQSLTEMLVALAIGVVFINVGIMAMATANVAARVNRANNYALSLLKSQRDTIETIASNSWHSIADLTIGKHYKLAKQNNSWVIQPGEEKVFDEKPPVAQWNFDEGTGATAYDNVGTNNGTLMNSPTWQTSPNCVSGSCLGFNGSNSYVNIKNNSQLQLVANMTVEFWINPTNLAAGRQNILDKAYGGEFSFTQEPEGGINYFYGTSGGLADPYQAFGVTPVVQGQWQHFVLVRDFTNSKLSWYRNGSLVSSTPTVYSSAAASAYDVRIGLGYTGVYYNGSIDDVRIYDYALTDSQVRQHYNAGLNRLGLVAQWGMDEGSGVKAYDSQGANDGTLVNSPTWRTGSNCVSGNCLVFTGSQYINCGTSSVLTPANISVSAWVKASTLDEWNGIISNMTTWGTGFGLQIGTTQNIAATISGNYLKTSWVPTTSTWYYIAATHDNTSNLNILYVNGKEEARVVKSVSYEASPKTYIGVFYTSPNLLFKGNIDDVRIYNRALSADEIANQYKDGYTRYFYVNNVSRDIGSDPTASSHNLEATYNASHDDPNTKKVVNVTRYLLGTPGRVNTQEQYLARVTNINSLIQTDWSGNSGVNGPEIDFGNNYYSAGNLNLSTAGQMSLVSTGSNGTLTSTIIDTQSINGAGYFNILWQGDPLCTGCSVRFQIAASNCSNGATNYPTCNTGTWTYYGPIGTGDCSIASNCYVPSGPGIPVPITYAGLYSGNAASVQNKRYIRYQITLVPASSVSPVVKDVIINYAP